MMNIIPLDMSIICNAFCCARVPGQEIDKIDKYKESRHVVVASNGHFYSLNVIQPNGKSTSSELSPPIRGGADLQRSNPCHKALVLEICWSLCVLSFNRSTC